LTVRRDRLLKRFLRERFVVTLKTGETFDGLLDEWDEHNLLFLDAYAVTEKSRVGLDGSGLWVQRENVAYLQRLA
jgi:small nuclear ribonucleoprotein (snRNP)-like protein